MNNSVMACGGSHFCRFRRVDLCIGQMRHKKTDKDILISIVFSYFVFKEKLTKKSLAGLLLMVCGTLMLYSRISRVTTFYPISHYCSTDAVALFNLRGHAVQLQRSRCSIWCGILICARLRYVSGKEWGSKRYLCMKYLTEAAADVA